MSDHEYRLTDRFLHEDDEPALGSHLVTPRLGFAHHGIYVGGGKVVHYGALAESLHRGPVEEVPVARFAQGHGVWVRSGSVAGFDPGTIVRRARSRIGEDQYRLLSNNCEHFCEWCMNGQARSYQVDRLLTASRRLMCLASASLALLLSIPLLHA